MSSHLAKAAPFKLVQRSLASQPAVAAVTNTNAPANPTPDVKVRENNMQSPEDDQGYDSLSLSRIFRSACFPMA